MAYWIVKTEPTTYSHGDLTRDGTTVWDGVRNPVALKHIGQMAPGDEVLVYHTGDERAVAGFAKVASQPYPDPRNKDPKLVVVKLAAGKRLARPVTLAQIKADPAFADSPLVRVPRLSVIPATPAQWRRLLVLGGG